MRRRNTPPTPLQRGGWRYYFLFDNKTFSVQNSPLERGLKGCVTVRCAGWDEIVFSAVWRCGVCWLLVVAFDFQVAVHRRDTPPTPLQRGGWDVVFLFDGEDFSILFFPLAKGGRKLL